MDSTGFENHQKCLIWNVLDTTEKSSRCIFIVIGISSSFIARKSAEIVQNRRKVTYTPSYHFFFVTISLLFLGTGSNVVKGDMASTLSFSTISRWCFHSFYSLSWPNLLFFFISSCQGPSSYTPPAALDRNSRKKLDLLWAARSLPWHRQFFSLRRLVKLTDVNNLPMRLLTV